MDPDVTAESDGTDLNTSTEIGLSGEHGEHFLHGAVEGFDLARLGHASAGIKQEEDGEWTSLVDCEFLQFDFVFHNSTH